MKLFATYLFVLMPWLVFGQLFPKVPDFKGNTKKIIERRYGKEVYSSKNDSGVFKPGAYSEWEYTYLFNEKSQLLKRTNTFQGKVMADFQYEHETIGNRMIMREITKDDLHGQQGDYIEYENFADQEGRIEKVNCWSFDAQTNLRKLFLVETNAKYNNNKLVSFIRENINENGEPDKGERIELIYDNAGRLIRIERSDNATNLKTILYYNYDKKGSVEWFAIDYMVGLRNNQNTRKQNIYFKYDNHGNWTKRYYLINKKKKGLESKRKIEYW